MPRLEELRTQRSKTLKLEVFETILESSFFFPMKFFQNSSKNKSLEKRHANNTKIMIKNRQNLKITPGCSRIKMFFRKYVVWSLMKLFQRKRQATTGHSWWFTREPKLQNINLIASIMIQFTTENSPNIININTKFGPLYIDIPGTKITKDWKNAICWELF